MITPEMVRYWLGDDGKAEVINDFKDIANGKYEPSLLKQDILATWRNKEKNNGL